MGMKAATLNQMPRIECTPKYGAVTAKSHREYRVRFWLWPLFVRLRTGRETVVSCKLQVASFARMAECESHHCRIWNVSSQLFAEPRRNLILFKTHRTILPLTSALTRSAASQMPFQFLRGRVLSAILPHDMQHGFYALHAS